MTSRAVNRSEAGQQRVDDESDHDGGGRREPVLARGDPAAGQFEIQVL